MFSYRTNNTIVSQPCQKIAKWFFLNLCKTDVNVSENQTGIITAPLSAALAFEIQQRTEQVLNDKRCKCTIKQLDSVNSMLVLSETTRQCKLYVSAIRAIINIHCIKDIKLQHLHTAMLAGAVF